MRLRKHSAFRPRPFRHLIARDAAERLERTGSGLTGAWRAPGSETDTLAPPSNPAPTRTPPADFSAEDKWPFLVVIIVVVALNIGLWLVIFHALRVYFGLHIVPWI
jgi:hypothetical protein